jgi:hypothetical protein
VTEDYDVVETFRIDPSTLTSPALDHWLSLIVPGGLKPGMKPHDVLFKGVHFFACVQPKWTSEAISQKLFYELDVLSLSPTKQSEPVAINIDNEVDKIVSLGLTRTDTLSKLKEKGSEYIKNARNRGLV